jgi:aryl-alcohol dehydrogenase-like predicted oxidoreductase
MRHVSLGGLDVSRIGLGAMTMAGTYTTEGGLDDAESIRTINRALDLGGHPHRHRRRSTARFTGEELVGKAIKGRRRRRRGGDEVRPGLANLVVARGSPTAALGT